MQNQKTGTGRSNPIPVFFGLLFNPAAVHRAKISRKARFCQPTATKLREYFAATTMASIMLTALAMPFPAMSKAVP